jgi:hypothetical protein
MVGGRNAHIPPVLEARNVAGAEEHLLPEENVAVEGGRRNRRLEQRMITRGSWFTVEYLPQFKAVGAVTLLHNAFLDGKIRNLCL